MSKPKLELTESKPKRKLKLTETSVAKLKAPDPSGNQVVWWDTEVTGFGVLCSGVKTAKSYIAQRRVEGKICRVTIGDARTLPVDEARDRAAKKLDEMRRGINPKAKPEVKTERTLRTTLRDYLAARKDLRPASIKAYHLAAEHYLASWLDLPLREITPDMVEERHRAIKASIAAAAKRVDATGNSTANGTMRAFRTLWNFAAEDDASLPPNPVRRLKRQWYGEPRREGHVPATALPRFYAALHNVPNAIARDYLLLLLFTGLRRSEAAALTWDDIDFEARTLRIPAERAKGKRKLALPMTDFVFEMLAARAKLGKAEFVFLADSASGHIEEPRAALETACKDAGIPCLKVHDLRRTFITVAESADISPIALKALVNHSLGGDVTMGYVQLTAERLREPAQRVCDRMKQLCGIVAPEAEAGSAAAVAPGCA